MRLGELAGSAGQNDPGPNGSHPGRRKTRTANLRPTTTRRKIAETATKAQKANVPGSGTGASVRKPRISPPGNAEL